MPYASTPPPPPQLLCLGSPPPHRGSSHGDAVHAAVAATARLQVQLRPYLQQTPPNPCMGAVPHLIPGQPDSPSLLPCGSGASAFQLLPLAHPPRTSRAVQTPGRGGGGGALARRPAHLRAVEVAVEASWAVGCPRLVLSILAAAGGQGRAGLRCGEKEGGALGRPYPPGPEGGPPQPSEGRRYLDRLLVCTMEAQRASVPTRRMQAAIRRKKRMMKATTRAMLSQVRSLQEKGNSVRGTGCRGAPPAPPLSPPPPPRQAHHWDSLVQQP